MNLLPSDPDSPAPIDLGEDSMSQTLVDFAQPALDETSGGASYRSALTLAVMAWNLSLLPEDKREFVLETRLAPLLELYQEGDRATVRQIVEMLIQRKLDQFSAWPGFIVGFDLDESQDPPSLTVTTSGGATQ